MDVPEQGDIVLLDFDPSAGREIIKRRPALVLSRKVLHSVTGMAIVAPITSTQPKHKLHVALLPRQAIQGFALLFQLKALDYEARNCEVVERAGQETIDSALHIAKLLVS